MQKILSISTVWSVQNFFKERNHFKNVTLRETSSFFLLCYLFFPLGKMLLFLDADIFHFKQIRRYDLEILLQAINQVFVYISVLSWRLQLPLLFKYAMFISKSYLLWLLFLLPQILSLPSQTPEKTIGWRWYVVQGLLTLTNENQIFKSNFSIDDFNEGQYLTHNSNLNSFEWTYRSQKF